MNNAILVGMLAFAGSLVMTCVWWGLRHARIERELDHAERIRALEMGVLLPKDQPWWTPEKVAVAIGAGVPISAFVLTLSAAQSGAAGEAAWIAAGAVGVAGVICGTFLATRLPSHQTNPMAQFRQKPYVNPADRELSEHLV